MKVRLGRSMSGVNVDDVTNQTSYMMIQMLLLVRKLKAMGQHQIQSVRKVTVTNVKAARLTDCQS